MLSVVVQIDVSPFARALDAMDGALETVLPAAVGQASDEFAVEARNAAPTGKSRSLRNSILPLGIEGSWEGDDLSGGAGAGAPHALYVEEGTRDHWVRPRFRTALAWEVEGGFAFSRGHVVRGIEARHFMAGALEAYRPRFEIVIGDGVRLAARLAGFA